MIYALRMALRQCRLQPAFVLVTVLVLGLGTGAATVGLHHRRLGRAAAAAVSRAGQAGEVLGHEHREGLEPRSVLARHLHGLQGAAGVRRRGGVVAARRQPPRPRPRSRAREDDRSSGNLFSVLGVETTNRTGFPAGGPFFSNDLIAVISDRLWRTRYNADPTVIGRLLNLNGTSYQVVGVMPPGFSFPDDVDVWQRLRWDLTQHSRSAHFMEGVARLADGIVARSSARSRHALARTARQRIRQQQQRLVIRHRPPARRSAWLLPAGAVCAVWRRWPAFSHRLPERGVAAADAGAVARA